MAKKARCVVSSSPEAETEQAKYVPIDTAIQLDGVKATSPSPAELPSSSASSTTTPRVPLPIDIIRGIAQCLHDAEQLKTLSSLSLLSKASHDLATPILFRSITIRNHRQLACILSSLDTLRTDQTKRKTRKSGPDCDVKAKLARFALTKHLFINHFPSLDNLARLAALEGVFTESPIFISVQTLTLAPILMHRLHPGACGAAAAETRERLKTIYFLRQLAHPAHLTVDMRGTEDNWIANPSEQTTHGCLCIDQFCGRLERIWITKRSIKELVIHLDTHILSTHFISTSANGPTLELLVHPSRLETTSQPHTKRGRKSTTAASATPKPISMTDAIASFLYHRVLQADEHRGGKTTITITGEDGEGVDVDEISLEASSRAKDMAGENRDSFKTAKARAMLKAIQIKDGTGTEEEAESENKD